MLSTTFDPELSKSTTGSFYHNPTRYQSLSDKSTISALSLPTNDNTTKQLGHDIQYRNIDMNEGEEQNALRKTILQLTSNQILAAYEKFVNPKIHKPMLNLVHKYNKNEDRPIDVFWKDPLEILPSQHAMRNADDSKIYVSADFLAFIISCKAKDYSLPSIS